jgi:hypothetical protein
LLGIFGSRKGEPPVVVTRLQRYIIRASIFDYEIKYREGKKNGNADCLSRLPVKDNISEEDMFKQSISGIKFINSSETLTLNFEMIKNATSHDEVLLKVKNQIIRGWNNNVDKNVKKYFDNYDSLSIDSDCIFMNNRIIIPTSLKLQMLEILHSNHLGILRMKQVAREYCFLFGMNKDIENFDNSCENCQ